jgi:hypothetical protein
MFFLSAADQLTHLPLHFKSKINQNTFKGSRSTRISENGDVELETSVRSNILPSNFALHLQSCRKMTSWKDSTLILWVYLRANLVVQVQNSHQEKEYKRVSGFS